MLYSMKQLQTITGKPPQTINRLMRKNEKLSILMEEHRIKQSNGQVFYDEVILEWLKEYFQLNNAPAVEDDVANTIIENNPGENLQTQPRAPINEEQIEELRKRVNELEEIIVRKDKVIADLEEQLKAKEAERLHFITQNGQLTALLLTEQQERIKLLPPPKQPLGVRIKEFFGRNKGKEVESNDEH